MALTASQFRDQFPEFCDTTTYPEDIVSRWIGIAVKLLPESRWQDMLDVGVGLYTAHHLAIQTRNMKAGATPGQVSGVIASKAVDKVSVSYDTSAASLGLNAGHWALTVYGNQFLTLARMAGTGGIQL